MTVMLAHLMAQERLLLIIVNKLEYVQAQHNPVLAEAGKMIIVELLIMKTQKQHVMA